MPAVPVADSGSIKPTHEPIVVTSAADAAGWPDPKQDGNAWMTWRDPWMRNELLRRRDRY